MGIPEDIERAKGQAKETVGEHARNPDLEAEGKNDQDSADIKETVNKVADKLTSGVDAIKEKLKRKS